jgi:hypothetical protein
MGWGEQDTKQCKSSRETTFACFFHLQGRKNDLKSQLFLSNGDLVTIYFNGFHGSGGDSFHPQMIHGILTRRSVPRRAMALN